MVRGVFRTQASMYDGTFSVNTLTIFAIKAPSQMFDWVMYKPLKINGIFRVKLKHSKTSRLLHVNQLGW